MDKDLLSLSYEVIMYILRYIEITAKYPFTVKDIYGYFQKDHDIWESAVDLKIFNL